MLWSWYLADDTQFYVLGCLLLILAVRSVLHSYVTGSVSVAVAKCRTLVILYIYVSVHHNRFIFNNQPDALITLVNKILAHERFIVFPT